MFLFCCEGPFYVDKLLAANQKRADASNKAAVLCCDLSGMGIQCALVVGVDGAPHTLNDDEVSAHRGVCQGVWHTPQIQARAALPIARHIQPRFPAHAHALQ